MGKSNGNIKVRDVLLTLRHSFNSDNPPRSLTPLFWVHGEDERTLRKCIARMDEGGCAGFIVESRTHEDFLKETWWRDMRIIINEAKQRNLKVWMFDDMHYPSGWAGGIVAKENPDLLKRFLREHHVDVYGSAPHIGSWYIPSWVDSDGKLIAVIAAKRLGKNSINGDTLLDLSSYIRDDFLYWRVPAGNWRLFFIVTTRKGGEKLTKDYIDSLRPEAVDRYIEIVFESTYRHFKDEFGKTFQGFFSDEPRLGNAENYDSLPGIPNQVLPYTDGLLDNFFAQKQYNLQLWLPALWYDCGKRTSSIRADYMDVLTRRFANTFFRRIGNWCRAHDVRWIGHVVEDNGSHARLGVGAGHYFRDMAHLDVGGLDVVYQVWPERTNGFMSSPFSSWNMQFFYWGIAKLASSAAHLDPKKHGLTMCECYGAYGWQEGLRLMKWLTDWQCVRGINMIVPHAFNTASYPDNDCPPHFWAHGHNPQWRFFRIWANYANRTCTMLTNGQHIAPIAVLYSDESQWAGKAVPFEVAVEALGKSHLDCDIIPYDMLVDKKIASIVNGKLKIAQESFRVVVLPCVEAIPAVVLERLVKFQQAGGIVMVLGEYPKRACDFRENSRVHSAVDKLRKKALVCKPGQVGMKLRYHGIADITPDHNAPSLRHLHYRLHGLDLYFLNNESLHQAVNTWVFFSEVKGIPEYWNPLTGEMIRAKFKISKHGIKVYVGLEPYESIFIVFVPSGYEVPDILETYSLHNKKIFKIDGPWTAKRTSAKKYPDFAPEPRIKKLGDWGTPNLLPDFSGTICYITEFTLPKNWSVQNTILDLGEVYELALVRLNGQDAGIRICPPYRFSISKLLRPGKNQIEVEVTNTLACAIRDGFSKFMPANPSGLLGPVRLL